MSEVRRPALWQRLLLAAAGGLAAELAAPPVNVWPFAIVSLALFICAVRGASMGHASLAGLTWGVIYYSLHLRWAFVATNALPWLALTVLQTSFAVFVALAVTVAMRARWASRYPAAWLIVALGSLWVMGDVLRGKMPFGGFPWGSLAVSQVDSPLKSLAWLGGSALITFTLVSLAVLTLSAIARLREAEYRAGGVRFISAVVIVALTTIVPLSTTAQSGTLTVGGVQGNVPNPGETPDGGVAWQVFMNHVDQTREMLDRPEAESIDLIMWPEDGAMTDLQSWDAAAEELQSLVDEAGLPLMLGTQEYPADGGRYNLVVLWEPERGEVARYAKQHPVPFGEYIPMRSFFRIFSDQVDRVSTDMFAGDRPAVMDVDVESLERAVSVATVICFEIAYRDIVKEAVDLGAEMIFVPTNNASFGRTPEAWQQLGLTRLSAIEYGRSAVQVSTVGVSAIVLADGTVVKETGHFTAESMIGDVPLRTSMTPAMIIGDGLIIVLGVLAIASIALGLWDIRRRKLSNFGDHGTKRSVTAQDG